MDRTVYNITIIKTMRTILKSSVGSEKKTAKHKSTAARTENSIIKTLA